MEIYQPRWSSWSFLLYAGGLTILGAVGALLSYLSDSHGDAAFALLALVVYAVVGFVALALRRAGTHPVAAGLLAFTTIWSAATFFAALFMWFGWLSHASTSAFHGFHLGQLVVELLTLGVALVALNLFRFPLLVFPVVAVSWFFVTDLLSGGGNWGAVITFLVGLVFLAIAVALDAGPSRPYGFWVHVAAGLTIGGSLLFFWHHGHVEWALVAIAGVLYVFLAEGLGRSSWAVLGTVGILAAAVHFTFALTRIQFVVFGDSGNQSNRGWAPALVFALAGVLLMVLGGVLARRRPVVA